MWNQDLCYFLLKNMNNFLREKIVIVSEEIIYPIIMGF